MKIKVIAISEIIVGDRRREDYGDLQSLADSILKYGLLQPIIVDDKNNLVAGERRLRASQLAGRTIIDCRLFSDLSENERREIELEENLQRKDLTPFERSKQISALAQTAEKIISSSLAHDGPPPEEKPKEGRPETAGNERKVAERTGIPRATIQRAKEHVAAVEKYPELESETQKGAITAARHLDKMPEEKRATANVSTLARKPLQKPGVHKKASTKWFDRLSDTQEFINDIRGVGGALEATGGWTEQERHHFFNELTEVRDRFDGFVKELDDYFQELKQQAG